MIEGLTQDDCRAILLRIRNKVPPEKVSPIFVKTRAAKEVFDRAYGMFTVVSRKKSTLHLIIKATRGAGKTAMIQYLGEQLQDEVFFVYQEKCSASTEDLFRYFVNRLGRQVLTEAVQAISSDPLEVHKILSERGHNGTAIALAGLLEKSPDAWSWLSVSSPALVKLKCGLNLVKNVRDTDALDALATVVRLLNFQKPVIFAIDELEGAYNELTNRTRGKLRSLIVDLINYEEFSGILFLFAATGHVYEECFLTQEADDIGLKRRVEDATTVLGLPTREEVRIILERILYLYARAYDFSFSEGEIRRIGEEFKALSTMPSEVISYALRKGDETWEFKKNYERIATLLKTESEIITKGLDQGGLSRKFEEAVGLLLKFVPGSENHISQPPTDIEIERLSNIVKGLKGIQKTVDLSFKYDSIDFWIEVCRARKKDSVIPSGKALAVFAKTLFSEGSAGLFVTHNFNRFGVGKGTGSVIARFPELMKRVAWASRRKIVSLQHNSFSKRLDWSR
ncbi:MAG: hypothetical protein HXS54_06790 [Theionarchaea archaeon]|nr:hypothetical protein [Theionarchaea archaeon]